LALPGAASKYEQGISSDAKVVRVYRVEGRINERIFIDESGNIDVPKVDTSPCSNNKFVQERMLYLNFGNEGRAHRFYKQRLKQYPEDSSFSIKSFDVLESVMNQIQASAVPMHKRRFDKDQPVIADPTKNSKEGLDQFGLPPKQIEKLREAIIPYSGKKITKLSP